MTFDAIADWLNKEGYLTVRRKKFRGAHVHSILKKRLAKEELLNRGYSPEWSDFSMEVVDKTILMSDFGFPDKGNEEFFMTSRFFIFKERNLIKPLQKLMPRLKISISRKLLS